MILNVKINILKRNLTVIFTMLHQNKIKGNIKDCYFLSSS